LIRKRIAKWTFSLAITGVVAAALIAASSTTGPIIGMTAFQNGITLDDAKVTGTATLFDGSKIQSEGYSRVHLNNGTRLDFGAGSKAQVFATHADLSAGMTEIQSPSGFDVTATGLKIHPSGSDAIARVKIAKDKVFVTALNAPVSVLNKDGLLVAKVMPGVPLQFMPQAGATAPQDDTNNKKKKKKKGGAAAGGSGTPGGSAGGAGGGGGSGTGWGTGSSVILGFAVATGAGIGGAAAAGAFSTPSP
jgi:hypothetical protein